MYLVRHLSIRTTPTALAEAFNARQIIFRSKDEPIRRSMARAEALIWGRDFFTFYPDTAFVNEGGLGYQLVSQFAGSNKYEQRKALAAFGLPTPMSFAPSSRLPYFGRYLLRPLRHMQREGFQPITVAARDETNTVPEGHYATEWLEIEKEYRTVFVKGQPVFTFFKTTFDEERRHDLPWTSTALDRLELNASLMAFPPIKYASIAAVDLVRTTQGRKLVLEINFAPGLAPRNLERVVEAWRA